MTSREHIRRVPRFMNWSEHAPSFEGMHGPQQARYQLSAFELDRLGKRQGGGLVGTFRQLEQARSAARAMQADNPAFSPDIYLDPDDRFAEHRLWEEGRVDEFRALFHQRQAAHSKQFEGRSKILNPFTHTWPGQTGQGEFIVSAYRLDLKDQPRQTVAQFNTEKAALDCFDAIVASNAKWNPFIKISF